MQEGQNARQQIVERIRQSTSILVALSNNPTVDALSASFALSLMLTKMNKHSTAVFSGVIPPAIEFLEPNKTFESNVDALRDFIISLDKEKADRLRYKVEDDVVRIFITPYKTSISEKDLEFSQGDFNVDLIIALGVEKREDLDKAIIAHGRILHDATIITVNPNTQRSSLGSIDWNDGSSSSLCEMLVTLSEAFQQPGILDAQISTALLTGIVAATERFSNTHTSPRVMTMAAQLMAAGANQQLIATNLAKAQVAPAPVAAPPAAGTLAKQPAAAQPTPMQEETPKKKEPGELDIAHDKKQQPAPAPKPEQPKQEQKPAPAPAPAPQPQKSAEEELAAALPTAGPSHNFIALKDELESAGKKEEGPEVEHKAPGSASVNGDEEEMAKRPDHEEEYLSSHGSWKGKRLEPPTLGGTLNATTEEAMEDSQKAQEEERNKTLLTHPEDRQQQQPKRKNKKEKRVVEPPAEPKPEPAPAPAPVPEPQPKVEPAPAPIPAPAPVAAPDLPPLPPVPTFNPAPTPEPVAPPQPEQPAAPAPAPEPKPEPIPMPAPAPIPAPAPAPAPESEPNLDTLAASAAEAAAAAQPAASAAGDIDNARQAVTSALEAAPFDPAHHPMQSAGAQEVPPMPSMPVSEPLSQDALQALPPAPAPAAAPSVQAPAPAAPDLPPLPPMPPMPSSSDALPPAPNLPGLNQPLPPMAPDASTQPQNPPAPTTPPAPADPAQFKIPGA